MLVASGKVKIEDKDTVHNRIKDLLRTSLYT